MKKTLLILIALFPLFSYGQGRVVGTTVEARDSIMSLTNNTDLVLRGKGTGNVSIEGSYTLPASDGTAGQILTTDGSGALSFQDASGGVSFGLDNQIPVVNSSEDDLEYSSNFTYDGISLIANGTGITSVSMGFITSVTGARGVGIGRNVSVSGLNGVGLSANVIVLGTNGLGVGLNSTIDASNGIGIGAETTVSLSADGGMALGRNSTSNAGGAIMMGYDLTNEQTNSLANSFELSWDGTTQFKVGETYGTGITTNTDPDTNLTDAIDGVIAYDETNHEFRGYVNGSWETLGGAGDVTAAAPFGEDESFIVSDGVDKGVKSLGDDLTYNGSTVVNSSSSTTDVRFFTARNIGAGGSNISIGSYGSGTLSTLFGLSLGNSSVLTGNGTGGLYITSGDDMRFGTAAALSATIDASTQNWSFEDHLLTDVADPVDDQDAATKIYVDQPRFHITQYKRTLGTAITVTNGSSFNLMEDFVIGDKTAVSATGDGALNITTDVGEDYIQINWRGVIESLDIRVTIDIDQSGTDFYEVALKRVSDDSVVGQTSVAMDGSHSIASVLMLSYVGSATDSFVTDGFYITFENESGQSADLQNDIDILIKRTYQSNPD
jgi:hypothetical protein